MWRPGDDHRNDKSLLLEGRISNDYPISKFQRLIAYTVEHYAVTVIVGDTGTGKSTQIPQYLFPHWCSDDTIANNKIVISQPNVSTVIPCTKRVQMEMNSTDKVGYRVRYEDDPSSSSLDRTRKIVYMTEHLLIREATFYDPYLSSYSIIILDDVHERSIYTDVLLGIVKKLLQQRPNKNDFRIILCTATPTHAQTLLEFLVSSNNNNTSVVAKPKKRVSKWDTNHNTTTYNNNNNNENEQSPKGGIIISVDERRQQQQQRPVAIFYSEKPKSEYIRSAVDVAFQVYTEGNVLCFLPCERDIYFAIQMMEEMLQEQAHWQHGNQTKNKQQQQNVECLPLHSSSSYSFIQQKILRSNDVNKDKTRQIIFATHIAETTIKVPNITSVIDCGYIQLQYFDPLNGLNRTMNSSISFACAQQRSNRASTKCFRLYTEESMNQVILKKSYDDPPIARTNITNLILILKALGIHNVLTFDYVTIPSVAAFSHALETLYLLKFISKDTTDLTPLGHRVSDFPTNDPRISKMLVESLSHQCSHEILCIAASLQTQQSLWFYPKKRSTTTGKTSSTTKTYLEYQASLQEVIHDTGDHITSLHIMDHYQKYYKYSHIIENDGKFFNVHAIRRAWEIHSQLSKCLKRHGSIVQRRADSDDEISSQIIRKCITSGFFGSVAKLSNDGHYYTLRGNEKVQISHNSILMMQSQQQQMYDFNDTNSKDYIVFCESRDENHNSNNNNIDGMLELLSCSYIQGKWLKEIAPDYFL